MASTTIQLTKVDLATSALREVPFTWALDTLLSPSTPPTDEYPPPIEASSDPGGSLVAAWYHPGVVALHRAFNDHRPLVLSPDIIWMFVAQGAGHHIRENAEEVRQHFVRHAGKICLRVQRDEFVRGSADNAWPAVVEDLGSQIRTHIGDTVHDLFLPVFSTTGPVERIAAGIVLLDTMQSYFEYEFVTLCGIPQIVLEGTPEDWQRVAEGARELSRFGLAWWTEPLLPILDEFVAASRGRANVRFWESIYKLDQSSGGPYITGWILALFPYLRGGEGNSGLERNPWLVAGGKELQQLLYAPERLKPWGCPTIERFPSGLARAPFRWNYYDEVFAMELLGGFVGIRQDKRTLAVRPEIGWAVHEPAAREPILAARAEAQRVARAADEKLAHERAQSWTRRGMCPRCEFWQYLFEGQPAVHCGVPLVRLEDRVR